MLDDGLFVVTPFTVLADEESSKHWAGRPKVLERIERILRRLERRNESNLDVIWANLGAGKSHTLYYLAHRIQQKCNNTVCVVVEVPEQIKNFRDLYQRIARKLPISDLANTLFRLDDVDLPEELRRFARAIVHGGAIEKQFASQWLVGDRPDLRQLRQTTGIGSRIDSDIIAADIFAGILNGLSAAGVRFCLMLDEFQRIGKLQQRPRSQITASLRSLLSKNPRNFSIFLAIYSKMEKTALAVLSEELRSIMGVQKPISLPEMDQDEALEFVGERLSQFRPPEYAGDDFAPFGRELVVQAIKVIATADHVSLIPRTILETLGLLYDELPEPGASLEELNAAEILEDLDWGGSAADE